MLYRTVLGIAFISLSILVVPTTLADNIQLVLQVTVDQLRGDFPQRLRKRFGESGFRYLMDNGVVYTNAHFHHSNTFTAVGHATLFTGGHTAQHGFSGNEWFDQQTGQHVYCVQDDRFGIVDRPAETYAGASPKYLTSTTIGDELILASGGRSRVFSVSIKDRGAIIPGGHMGKAFWYDRSTGEFITSKYYYDDYPSWVRKWNQSRPADRYRDTSWKLFQDRSKYIYGHMDDRPWERGFKEMGRNFPHPLSKANSEIYYSGLRFTPMGDELTLDFVKTLVKHENIGQGEHSDFLAISFSVTDYIGHVYGPNSLEYEDNILRLDATLEKLFSFIDASVGLQKTLIILSSDHGVSAIPEYKRSLGFSAGRHSAKAVVAKLDAALQRRYKSDANFVTGFWHPSVYLNLKTIEQLSLDIEEVEQALREEILGFDNIALAVTRAELLRGKATNTPLLNMVQLAFHPKRSGNLLIVQQPFWILSPGKIGYAAMHGSPYTYDTYVPIMVAGPGISPQSVHRSVGPEDIAPTIANLLGIKPPSGSVGDVLTEVVEQEVN